MQHMPEKLGYSVKEAVAATSLSKSNLYRRIRARQIETQHVGARIIIPAAAVQRLVEGDDK